PARNPNFPTFASSSDYTGFFNVLNSSINSPNPQLDPNNTLGVVPLANRPIWDVDNDGDGIPDSVWIDPGLPVVTSPDGRRYKRLAAILIKDLDGSINLNAHGNVQQVANVNYRAETNLSSGMVTGYTPPTNPYPYALG